MFLEATKKRNPNLIHSAVDLHQAADIPPNTYVIDMDTVAANTRALAEKAREHDFSLYFMTKQLGRIPKLAQWIANHGIQKAVAVEWNEASRLHESGIAVGHAGHLVQPGKHQWPDLLKMNLEVVTVFSAARAAQVSAAAVSLGIVQPVLLRVIERGDRVYPSQEGGFQLAHLAEQLPQLLALPGIRIEGVTSFPALELKENQQLVPTTNVHTLHRAVALLQDEGIDVRQVNAPSATSCETIPMLKELGVTHGEPGHALTGTTPSHAVNFQLEEKPSIVYVSEVSHDHYVIGGGFYERGNIESACVGTASRDLRTVRAKQPKIGYIDYYGSLDENEDYAPGESVVYAFRTQIFVTRANVALVSGIQAGKPKIVHFERRY
ncbi:alanine racemase [Geomicrobium sp. JSM 1781026]|uniref:alanine racemase n=1 Tax=Geomicrobium sp. JSM 1781026 TaxID=3344580 RepID=UPI0035C0B90F